MTSLASNLRSKLEQVVVEARDIAELGAHTAIEALAVHHHEPYGHMCEEERNLRNSLRAHARQVGDRRDAFSGGQEIDHLVSECAYEHWHRMLFARFLAENHLLIEPDSGVAVSLEECEEIAKEERVDTWTLASRYAQQMLPQIFRPDNPLLQVSLPREHRLKMEKLLDSLDSTVFTASDSLGWVYQFWQSKKKEAVNRSGKKIGGDELPAVTQLFTEPYMVAFLLDNSLGAWWATRRLTEDDFKNAASEAELRYKASIPGVPLEYLRFVQAEDGTWAPAAGNFEDWPKNLSDFKILDPCCGSGHFLVATLLILVPMRIELENLTAKEAVNAVLRENIHGLELDQRCVELAAFALAITAWKYPNTGGFRLLPGLNVACSGLAISAKREEWLSLAGDNVNLRLALEGLYKQFKNAPVLGSLINPEGSLSKGSLFELKWEDVGPLLNRALSGEKDDEKTEMGIVARGIANAANLMAGRYQLVITNVPYLGREGHVQELKDFADAHFPKAAGDLATLMLERIFEYCRGDGACYIVLPQNWWVGRAYASFREDVIRKRRWLMSVALGEEAWETFGNRGPNTVLVGILSSAPIKENMFSAIDLSSKPNKPIISRPEKVVGLQGKNVTGKLFSVSQVNQLNNPDRRISLHPLSTTKFLNKYVDSGEGCSTGDADRFLKYFWEVKWDDSWIAYLTPDGNSNAWGGRELLMLWEGGKGELSKSPQARIQNTELWKRKGVLVGRVRGISTTLFDGGAYSKGAVLVCPKDENYLGEIYHFLKSKGYEDQVRALDPRVSASTSVLTKVGFNIESILQRDLPPKISSSLDQWIFSGHPLQSNNPLHVVTCRLLGYRWPAELNVSMELADEQREWVKRCEELRSYIDDDGIVCMSALRKEDAAADRLGSLLSAAFGPEWSPAKERDLLVAVGSKSANLDEWLHNEFFEQHCKLFGHRPFIWHIWDGRKRDGFHALINYHKLAEDNGKGRKLLEKLTYGYLGDWINIQKDGVKQGTGGAEDRLAAALELEKGLKAILEGEPPFDIFVRWKPIEEQPIGWEPDINDGVRLNIRPFMASDIPGGRTGAGILRWAPNVKWDKDRGKDVETAPWHSVFNGERINDYHLTTAEKMAARARTDKGENS